MNIYLLEPVKERLDSHDWSAKSYQGPVKIQAANEDRARHLASKHFCNLPPKMSTAPPTPLNPWNSTELVNCRKIDECDCTEERILEPKVYE